MRYLFLSWLLSPLDYTSAFFSLSIFNCYAISMLSHWAVHHLGLCLYCLISIVYSSKSCDLFSPSSFFNFFSIFVYCTNISITVIRKQKKHQFYVHITMDQQFLFCFWFLIIHVNIYITVILKDRSFHILLEALYHKDFFHIAVSPSS